MKKTLILFGALLISASLYFTACKKADVTSNPTADAATTTNFGRNAGQQPGFSDEPTGIATITEDEFNILNSGEYIGVKMEAPHKYIGTGPIGPQPPYDPCAQDWVDFQNWWNANIAYMQAWANAHCQPFRYCWSGKCVSIMFFVPPTRYCGDPIKYEADQRVFE